MFNDIFMKEQFRELVANVKIILVYIKESKEEAQKLKKEIKALKNAVKGVKK